MKRQVRQALRRLRDIFGDESFLRRLHGMEPTATALAPGLTLSVLPLGRAAAMDALVEGRADLVLIYVLDMPEAISAERLYDEQFLVVGRPEALPQAPALDLDAYCEADHVLISPGAICAGWSMNSWRRWAAAAA